MVFHPSLGDLFTLCAVIGGTLFLIRFITQAFGLFEDFDSLVEGTDTNAHIGDSDVSFKLLSLQGLTAFFTMFGLAGLASKQAGWEESFALLAALISGIIAVLAINKIFQLMGGLQSKGNINLNNAIGAEATVYLTISPNERGKVEITIQNRLRVLDAITEDKNPITTGERVRVLKIVEPNILLVESISSSTSAEKVS